MPDSRSLSAGAAAASWIHAASPSDRVIWERWATEPVQQVSGRTCFSIGALGSSTPRHCMITTGYSCWSPFSPYGLAARPPLGCAPVQLIRSRCRPRSSLVCEALTVTVLAGNS